jgi:cysteine desulfuration protein SufE
MSIEERQQEVIEELCLSDDWMDRYQMIIDMGQDLPPMAQEAKVEENLIKGCQSKVWLAADQEDGKVLFSADSDAIITKGIVSMMIRVLSGSSPEEILETDLHFIKDVGLQEHLSPTRSNGLAAMVKQMRMYALALSAKS